MSERRRVRFDPPRPVWVREVDRAGAWGVRGLMHEWVQVEEWGSLRWCARVSTHDPGVVRLVPDSSVLPRDDDG